MTPEDYSERCQDAGLTVRSTHQAGALLCVVVVKPLPVDVETLSKRLKQTFTLSYGDGTTDEVWLWFLMKDS